MVTAEEQKFSVIVVTRLTFNKSQWLKEASLRRIKSNNTFSLKPYRKQELDKTITTRQYKNHYIQRRREVERQKLWADVPRMLAAGAHVEFTKKKSFATYFSLTPFWSFRVVQFLRCAPSNGRPVRPQCELFKYLSGNSQPALLIHLRRNIFFRSAPAC
ncbi:hypothetical protein EVAR_89334_1 [Eumeta japonica]|uniref:Uncharacterized protein n=1 Tax=Eumeta variegata TaxID=151549 RepID=A0A4C1Y0Q1_EUMVA|nr:hypothetical protein EVAR_89334_1 [Eumeta japonica]